MFVLLALLSALAVLLFVGVLVYFLARIVRALESIGGAPNSYLARIRYGVRAIEQETGHLAPQVTRLNGGLAALADGLAATAERLRLAAAGPGGGGPGGASAPDPPGEGRECTP